MEWECKWEVDCGLFYESLLRITEDAFESEKFPWKLIWKSRAPPRVVFLMWEVAWEDYLRMAIFQGEI